MANTHLKRCLIWYHGPSKGLPTGQPLCGEWGRPESGNGLMHEQFIEPTKHNTFLVIPPGANSLAVDMINTGWRV